MPWSSYYQDHGNYRGCDPDSNRNLRPFGKTVTPGRLNLWVWAWRHIARFGVSYEREHICSQLFIRSASVLAALPDSVEVSATLALPSESEGVLANAEVPPRVQTKPLTSTSDANLLSMVSLIGSDQRIQ
jgi:hypothetical protein